MKTYNVTEKDIIVKWFVVDASEKTLGRLSSTIASILIGKNKPIFSPNVDVGDRVIVLNADKLKVTGNKVRDKIYYHHSGYPGGIKAVSCGELLAKDPGKLIEYAVCGMLPKNKLRKARLKKLRVYRGSSHPHEAQKPETIEI